MKTAILTVVVTWSVVRGHIKDCITPDGYMGECVSLYQCPHVADLLQLPAPPSINIEYVRKSKCNGTAPYSVCCGPDKKLSPREVMVGDCQKRVFLQPPHPKSQCCGIEDIGVRLLFGTQLAIDQYPWLALIQYDTASGTQLYCGGSLISSKYVLTAAHCVTGPILQMGTPVKVRLGDYNTTSNGPDCLPTEGGGLDCTDPATIISIERIIPHPDYDIISNRNDIALMRLKIWAPYTDFIRPICMPTTDIDPTGDLAIITAGWGATWKDDNKRDIKQEARLLYVNKEICQSIFKMREHPTNVWERTICVGGERAYIGDSGGPLIAKRDYNLHYEILGIESFNACDAENITRVYTKAFEYRDWIRNTIEDSESVFDKQQ